MMSNFTQRVSKDSDVINAERSNACDNRFQNDIRTVVSTTDTNFQNRRIDLLISARANSLIELYHLGFSRE